MHRHEWHRKGWEAGACRTVYTALPMATVAARRVGVVSHAVGAGGCMTTVAAGCRLGAAPAIDRIVSTGVAALVLPPHHVTARARTDRDAGGINCPREDAHVAAVKFIWEQRSALDLKAGIARQSLVGANKVAPPAVGNGGEVDAVSAPGGRRARGRGRGRLGPGPRRANWTVRRSPVFRDVVAACTMTHNVRRG
eukprot:COSAG01_NODE_1766_length_9274_cov_3.461094_5_plen_195_part_00